MKKVICIDDSEFIKNAAPSKPQISVGDIRTVEREYIDPIDDDPVYDFIEHPEHMYSQCYFAPLSDLDETTLVNEEWEEKVCVPVNSKPCV